MAGDGVGRHAIGYFQQGRTAFTDIGAWVMIAMVQQFLALGRCQVEGTLIGGHRVSVIRYARISCHYPI